MICFVCKKMFNENESHFNHLKRYHFLKYIDDYRCCGSVYKNSTLFKKHVRTRHPTSSQSTNVAEKTTNKGVENNIFCSDQFRSTKDNGNINESSVSEKFNIKTILKNLLTFQTQLYSNIHLPRKDAEDINENMVKLIIEPLLSQFCDFGKKLNNDFYTKICKFTDECRQLFNLLKTEHLLKKG